MNVIARKTTKSLFITAYYLIGAVIMIAACVVVPISVFSIDTALFANLFVWGVVVFAVLFFASVGFFGFLRPFITFKKLPEVQAETDGTYLYIHSKKEAKIPLAEMDGTYIDSSVTYLISQELVVRLLSDQYGSVTIKVPNYGKYKLYFISRAQEVPQIIADLIASQP